MKRKKATMKIESLATTELTFEIKNTAKEPIKSLQVEIQDEEKIELELNANDKANSME